jgi:hypothetical protein
VKPRLLIDSLVLEFMSELSRRDRSFLKAYFEAIRDAPSRYAEFGTKDETGRTLDGCICGRFAVTFWDDFADRHVKIMGVAWADGRPRK